MRFGYTTGACAAAAAKGATLLLLGREVSRVELLLPWGKPEARPVAFSLVAPERGDGWAACGVVKDAGDDPDVTDGVEIRAVARWRGAPSRSRQQDGSRNQIRLAGGPGVGRVTKPGLAVAVGEAAINPVPRQMILSAAAEATRQAGGARGGALDLVVSVPRGEVVAQRTLNARLGIVGGISILGTTGIVVPMSADAWTATIDSALDVARATGLTRVVLCHGRSSEAAAEALLAGLAPEAFILMGDHVGYSVRAAASRRLEILLAGQFAKFCKVAAGNLETHVRDSRLDLGTIAELLTRAGSPPAEAARALGANTAREVFQRLRARDDRTVFGLLAARVAATVAAHVAGQVPVEALLFGYDRELLARAREEGAAVAG